MSFKAVIFNLVNYLKLVDWSGPQKHEHKIGAISPNVESILKQLTIFQIIDLGMSIFPTSATPVEHPVINLSLIHI